MRKDGGEFTKCSVAMSKKPIVLSPLCAAVTGVWAFAIFSFLYIFASLMHFYLFLAIVPILHFVPALVFHYTLYFYTTRRVDIALS